MNPDDGRYYFGGYHEKQNSSGYTLYFNLRSIDPEDGRLRDIAQIPVESKPTSFGTGDANGDIVFDSSGNFHLLLAKQASGGNSEVKIVSLAAKKLPTNNEGDFKEVAPESTATRSIPARDGVANSLAADADGWLILATGTTAFKVDPTTFRPEKAATDIHGGGSLSNTDFASCNFPPTLEVKKNVEGRVADDDQFKLTADDPTDDGSFASAETTGNEDGVQKEQIGPVIVRSGQEYVIQEQMADGSSSKLDDYGSWPGKCRLHLHKRSE